MGLEVLEGAGARVAEHAGVGGHAAALLLATFVVQHPEALRRHAVDGPLGVAVVVADGDGEASVVGPDEVDLLARPAGDGQRLALARVRRVVARLFEIPSQGCSGRAQTQQQ